MYLQPALPYLARVLTIRLSKNLPLRLSIQSLVLADPLVSADLLVSADPCSNVGSKVADTIHLLVTVKEREYQLLFHIVSIEYLV